MFSPPEGRKWDSKGAGPFGEESEGANEGTRQWRNSAEESPMSKGAFGYTDSKSDHCELRGNRAGESPMSKGVFEYTDFKNDYCELRVEESSAPLPYPQISSSATSLAFCSMNSFLGST